MIRPTQTLIGSIERNVNLAIDRNLDDTFAEEARTDLADVAERMSLSEEQALVFVLFMEKCTEPHIQLSDFAKMLGCRTVRIIAMMAETDILVEQRLIRKLFVNNTVCYRVPGEVITAVKENRTYTPEPIAGQTCEALFDRMEQLFDEADEDSSSWKPAVRARDSPVFSTEPRKRTVGMILQGEEPSFDQLDEYCRSELPGNAHTGMRRRLGF